MGTGGKSGAARPSKAAAGKDTRAMANTPLRESRFLLGASANHATAAASRAEITMEVRGEVKATTAVAGTRAANKMTDVHSSRTFGRSITTS